MQKIRAGDKDFVMIIEVIVGMLEYAEGIQRESDEKEVDKRQNLWSCIVLEGWWKRIGVGEGGSGSGRETGGE